MALKELDALEHDLSDLPLKELQVMKIREVITRLLTDFHHLTKTMLSAHVSPYGKAYDLPWSDVLDGMVADGTVIREAILHGQRATVVYKLADKTN